ncbi:hypothetical protein HHI36_018120 [Cryptolaemus montrouzieri]|uniref:Uncharacterized protein n=1 Tax=Cryptolaemus montrouzieri TaxID=559131 RepID=A0ABD2NZ90_9CUCU
MTNFHDILNPAFISGFSHNNITNAFKEAGICLINRNEFSKEATVPSASIAAPLAAPEANETRVAGIGEILEIPQPPKVPASRKKSFQSKIQMEASEDGDDKVCGKCRKDYSEDAKEKNEAKWCNAPTVVCPTM